MDNIQTKSEVSPPGEKSQLPIPMIMRQADGDVKMLDQATERIRRRLDLDEDLADQAHLEALFPDLGELDRRFRDFEFNLARLESERDSFIGADVKDERRMRADIWHYGFDLGHFQAELMYMDSRCQDAVAEERQGYSAKARKAGWWSIGFYSLGWTLGLIGKLSGDDEIVEVG